MSWKLPPKDSRNGLIRSFKLQYNKTHGSFTKTVTLSGNSTLDVTLNKLSIYTEYVYQIWAHTIGDGPASRPENFTTPEDGEYDEYKVTQETRNNLHDVIFSKPTVYGTNDLKYYGHIKINKLINMAAYFTSCILSTYEARKILLESKKYMAISIGLSINRAHL